MVQPNLPKGLVEREGGKPKLSRRFASTVMGTAVFVMEMQKKVSLRTKILIGGLSLAVVILGVVAFTLTSRRNERRQEADAALALPNGEGCDRLRAVVADGLDEDYQALAYAYLGNAHDTQAVNLLIEGLSGNANQQHAAAVALSQIGSPEADGARDPLAELLPVISPEHRFVVAWALATLSDHRGLDLAVEGLASGDVQELPSFDERRLATLLGSAGLRPRLMHPNTTVQQFAARWLGPVCDPSAVPPLVQASRSNDHNVMVAATVSLAQCGTPEALQAASSSILAHPQAAANFEEAFANDVGATGLGLLYPAGNVNPQVLTERIHSIFDPRSGNVFIAELERNPDITSTVRLEMVRTMADTADPRTGNVAAPLLNARNDDWTRHIIEAFGHHTNAAVVENTLLPLLSRASVPIQNAIFDALANARACAPAALRRSGNRRLDQSTILKLWTRCDDPRAERLARANVSVPSRNSDTAQAMRLAAYNTIVARNLTDQSSRLMEVVRAPDVSSRIRVAAADALGQIGTDAQLDALVDSMMAAGGPAAIREAAKRALCGRLPTSAVGRLMGYLRSGQQDSRTMAAVAVLGERAPTNTYPELAQLLEDERAREHAAFVLALGGNDESTRALIAFMQRERSIANQVRSRLGQYRPTLTTRALEDGHVVARLSHLRTLRDAGIGAFWDHYTASLAAGDNRPGGASAAEIRRHFSRMLQGADPTLRRLAADTLIAMGARGIVLARRAEGGNGADEADAAL